jgi:hypothetical protein
MKMNVASVGMLNETAVNEAKTLMWPYNRLGMNAAVNSGKVIYPIT